MIHGEAFWSAAADGQPLFENLNEVSSSFDSFTMFVAEGFSEDEVPN